MITERKKLLTPQECKKILPLSEELREVKASFDKALKDNLTSRLRYTVVCGPCSADGLEPMEEYLCKLKHLADECPDLSVVARVYTSKPHSNGTGYKGSCFCSSANEKVDVEQGILRCRKIMLKCLELGLPVADELLYADFYEYFSDLVSYWFVGARSSEDTFHRDIASLLDVCCGVKNGTDGDVEKAVDSVYAVSNPCVFPYGGDVVYTSGCKSAHIVLRGGKTASGFESNISRERVDFAADLLKKYNLNDFIMADLSHANSSKIAVNQLENAKIAIENKRINGVMLESYLYGGTSQDAYGVSKTDDCLDFEKTKELLHYLQNAVSTQKRNS